MKEISFCKMVASGNDFVVIDNRKHLITEPASFARKVCRRHTGVGGDGVLLIENGATGKVDYRVQIFNSDGSSAEACGNGFRCVSLFAHEKLGFPVRQRFKALSGIMESEVKGGRVRVRLTDPAQFKSRQEIEVQGRKLHYFFIVTGVPHVVIFVEGIGKAPVFEIGKAIRFHPRFKPAGTNVNFVEVTNSQAIRVRTYERGVEAETLACGTGSTASAVISGKLGYVKPPVKVKTWGGEILTVDFRKSGEEIRDVFLEGDAEFVFEGKWKG